MIVNRTYTGAADPRRMQAAVAGDPPVALYTYGLDRTRSTEDGALAAALERSA